MLRPRPEPKLELECTKSNAMFGWWKVNLLAVEYPFQNPAWRRLGNHEKGCFHLARIPPDTPSARVGMPPRRANTSNHLDRVAVTVQSFWLCAEPEEADIVHSYLQISRRSRYSNSLWYNGKRGIWSSWSLGILLPFSLV
jgi:hypothetical protein